MKTMTLEDAFAKMDKIDNLRVVDRNYSTELWSTGHVTDKLNPGEKVSWWRVWVNGEQQELFQGTDDDLRDFIVSTL